MGAEPVLLAAAVTLSSVTPANWPPNIAATSSKISTLSRATVPAFRQARANLTSQLSPLETASPRVLTSPILGIKIGVGSPELQSPRRLALSESLTARIWPPVTSIKGTLLLSTAMPLAVVAFPNTPATTDESISTLNPTTNESPAAKRLFLRDLPLKQFASVAFPPDTSSVMLLVGLVGGVTSVRPRTFLRTPAPNCVTKSLATFTSTRSTDLLFSTTT